MTDRPKSSRSIRATLPVWLFAGMACFAVMAGCGQKGPLYIPPSAEDASESETIEKSKPGEDAEAKSNIK